MVLAAFLTSPPPGALSCSDPCPCPNPWPGTNSCSRLQPAGVQLPDAHASARPDLTCLQAWDARHYLTRAVLPSSRLQLSLWAQCGGKSSAAGADAAITGACCVVNSQCVRVNEWYRQCEPIHWQSSDNSAADSVVYYNGCAGKTEVSSAAAALQSYPVDRTPSTRRTC